ncbi:E3 ubiquitin-protein ligase RNF13-like [Copidosoma floridanum]|uniref:E3 ubiquitin-protein ligase RNF13-like n=1 Tax=Copidosoma floridanum TaxID=29053 RepID=UPI0006C9C589|nr:E3 ubiquitin-protein ligase RNF13-like [Copidosoma floridanum]
MTHPGLAVMLVVGVGLGAVLYYFFASTPHEQNQQNNRQRNRQHSYDWAQQSNESRNRRQDEKSCMICLEDTNKDDAVRLVPCKHAFHKTCIEQWRVTGAGQARNRCPICRDMIVGLEEL